MSRTAITLKFKLRWFPNEGRYWAGKSWTHIKSVPLMPNEDKNIGDSLALDLGIWWRHVKTLYRQLAGRQSAWKPTDQFLFGSYLHPFVFHEFHSSCFDLRIFNLIKFANGSWSITRLAYRSLVEMIRPEFCLLKRVSSFNYLHRSSFLYN